MKNFNTLSKDQLLQCKKELKKQYDKYLIEKLNLNMSRGKPCKEQLDLSNDMLNINDYISSDNIDLRNYGILDGIKEAKELFSNILNINKENIIIGGNSTLNMIYDAISRLYTFGYMDNTPWCKLQKVKFLCPVPGYDRHFDILKKFNIEMINIPITENGINMDMVESLCKEDEYIKGIICVPLYSNPTGTCYSKENIDRLAKMKTKAKDFKIFWDNAYAIHHIYERVELYNIFDACNKYNTQDRIMYFFSTSKINFPGGGVSLIAGSDNTIKDTLKHLSTQTIGYDKINQLRTVKFLKNKQNTLTLMDKHANILKPKFDIVLNTLNTNFKDNPILKWDSPKGGYFVSVYTLDGLAKKVVDMCKGIGVILTDAGSTYPNMLDPKDSNIRLAPSFPTTTELQKAMDIFCLCVKIATIDKMIAQNNL
ncbi:aminotransferase class I/II-fold pyridoxal phosphate-dependent enzyme [uncultured Tyzzerella sp.]|uniref:aminotransferase class I/II-fold pyridoxal phosphate-dependent enzyme n=1 Tax=uncultured Tyzzerella sp. TaxID=2321398 RepID=UPI002942BA3D|nr:aminotransferase class I/II-fold pyridoxal phosphate-dependent enzyme [uncultured Tyzzerella sp.]